MTGRSVLFAAATGVGVFSLVMGAAASLLVDTDDLGAGTIDVASCDADGVDVQYVTSPVASDDPNSTDPDEGGDVTAPSTDSTDPALASVGTPTYYVTAVQVSGLSDACVGQRLEVSLYCDSQLVHMAADDATAGTSTGATRECIVDGGERFEFLSSNNTVAGPKGQPVQLGGGTQQFDVVDVEVALVDQVSVIITGDSVDGVGAAAAQIPEWGFQLDAAHLALTDGASVTSWPDATGGDAFIPRPDLPANSVDPAPVYTAAAAGFNGEPVVTFDGTDDVLGRAHSLPAGSRTIIAVYDQPVDTGNTTRGIFGAGDARVQVQNLNGAPTVYVERVGVYSGTNPVPPRPQIGVFVFSDSSAIHLDGGAPGVVQEGQVNPTLQVQGGNDVVVGYAIHTGGNNHYHHLGGLAWIGYADGDLRVTHLDELNALGQALAARYGVPWTDIPAL